MTDRFYTRLSAPLIVVSALLLGVGISAAWYVHSIQQRSAIIVNDHMASVRAGYELELSIREVRRHFFRYLFYRDKKYLAELPNLRLRADHWLKEANDLADMEQERELMKQINQGYAAFFEEYERLATNVPPAGSFDEIAKTLDDTLNKTIYEPVDAYQKLNEAELTRRTQTNERISERLIMGLIGVGVCGALGGVLVGWLIATSIRRNIKKTEERLRTTAQRLSEVMGENAPVPSTGELDAAVTSVSVSVAAVIDRLDRSQRDALRAEQLAYVGQMAAGIAHEVRNPLMAIKIIVQTAIERREFQRFSARDLEVLEDEIERVEQIVSQFLDFARPPRIEKQVLEAGPLLDRVTNRLMVRAEQQQVELNCITPGSPVFIDVDSGQFQQVLYNLVINALDSLPSGGSVRVELSVDSGSAVIRVEDDGTGLSDSLGMRIFEPFVSSKESGLGLGLSICKRIVDAHGGSITSANRPLGGAVFTVRLPVADMPAAVAVA